MALQLNLFNVKDNIAGKRIRILDMEYWFLPYDGIEFKGETKNLVGISDNKAVKGSLYNYSCEENGGKIFLIVNDTRFEVTALIPVDGYITRYEMQVKDENGMLSILEV